MSKYVLELVDPQSNQPWTIRVVQEGDAYGQELCLTHDDPRPMIEFYDGRYVEGFRNANGGNGWGQFVSRYYIETLTEHPRAGLCLDGGTPSWSVSHQLLDPALDWARRIVTPTSGLDGSQAAEDLYQEAIADAITALDDDDMKDNAYYVKAFVVAKSGQVSSIMIWNAEEQGYEITTPSDLIWWLERR